MGVEQGTRFLIALHRAEGTTSPLLGAEARAHTPEEVGIIRAVIDTALTPNEQTPEIHQDTDPSTLGRRVGALIQGLVEKIA